MRLSRLFATAVLSLVSLLGTLATAQPPAILRPSETIEPQPASAVQKPPVITAVAVVPGGGQVATAGDDHLVRIWSASTGELLHKMVGHADWVRCLAFSLDGQTLVSAGDDRQIIFWDTASGEKLHVLPAHPHVVYSLAYNHDGTQLATAGFESTVRIYDAHSLQLVRELEGPESDLRSVAYSPDGARLAVAGRGGEVRVWRLADGNVELNIPANGLGRLRSLAWLPDGEKLITAGENRLISVWDAHTGAAVHRIACPSGKLLSMTVCGEDLVATGGSDNVIRVWNWRDEREADQLVGHTGSVAALAFDEASGTIISGSFDTTVRVWRLQATGREDTANETNGELRVR